MLIQTLKNPYLSIKGIGIKDIFHNKALLEILSMIIVKDSVKNNISLIVD
jgi:hypothetical protein